MATAGHVDHGKSTLVHRLTGMEPDRWDEERRRGLTIDLGFVWTTLDGPDGPVTVAFVDVPGHQRFVPNMLAGAGPIAVAMLVVAADDGWSAQTAEHVAILDLLDVRGILTVIAKSDLVSNERLADVKDDVTTRLAGTSLGEAPVIAVDSLTHEGIPELTTTLATRLASMPRDTRGETGRLWIDRAFTVTGAGTVVTGTLQGGPLTVGQQLHHAPSGQPVRVRGLQALGQPVDEAPADTRVAVNLAGLHVDEVRRGHALLSDNLPSTTSADVMVRSIAMDPVTARGAWHLHVGTAEVPVRMQPLLHQIDPYDRGPARLELARPLPLRHGDRFVLRSAGTQTTPAGGWVLDPQPAPRAKGMLARLQLAELLDRLSDSAGGEAQLTALLQLHDGYLPERKVREIIDIPDVGAIPGIAHVGNTLVLAQTLQEWQSAALETVEHGPPDRGVNVTEVTYAVADAGCPQPLCRAVVHRFCTEHHLDAHGDILTLPERTTDYREARTRRQAAVVEHMAIEPLNPPDLDEVTQTVEIIGTELQELFDDGRLTQLGDVVVTTAAVDRARRLLAETFDHRGFTAAEARDVWQTTRKYAVPLLEHLAKTRITTFDGTLHHLTRPSDLARYWLAESTSRRSSRASSSKNPTSMP